MADKCIEGSSCGSNGAKVTTRRALRWSRIALWLIGVGMVYVALEAGLSIAAAIRAGSVALLGFGLDSGIECAASGVVFFHVLRERRGTESESAEKSEQRVRRFIGWTFLALAVYVLGQAGWTLWSRSKPEESTLGIIVAGAALVTMPLLAWGKLRAAREIGSRALRAEAKETIVCSYLSFATLVGLIANAWGGWWWADPVAALLIVPWLVREGLEGVRGEECADD